MYWGRATPVMYWGRATAIMCTRGELVNSSAGCGGSCTDNTLATSVDSHRPDYDPSVCQVNHVQRQGVLKLAAGSGACV